MKCFAHILYVAGVEESATEALEKAVVLAENNQATLAVLAVVAPVSAGIGMPEGGLISADLEAALVAECRQTLDQRLAPYRQRLAISVEVRVGIPFLETIRTVLRKDHDLLIKVAENPGWLDRLFGSDDMHLLRKCPCPVWLLNGDAPANYRCILAAVDVDDAYPEDELDKRYRMNRQILELASSLAMSEFAELHVATAWEAIGEKAMRGAFMNRPEGEIQAYAEHVRQQRGMRLDALLDEVSGSLGAEALAYIKPRKHLIKGSARTAIADLARTIDADLVVMGTVARTGVPGFLMGNTAETILGQIGCSVLAIKPPGFATPVAQSE